MRRVMALTAAGVLALASIPLAQQAGAIQAAAGALGAENIRTLQYTGSGRQFSVGQPPTATEPWPPVELRNFSASIDYETGSQRLELLRFMGPVMPRGGGAPFSGEQRQVQVVSGTFAWNVPPAAGGQAAPAAQPQPAAVAERMLQIWSTPHGFLKAAMKNNATTRRASAGTEASFTVDGKYRVTGLINAQNQVTRVQTWIDNPVLGDMLVETTYSDYRDFGGVQFPAQIRQTQGGHPALELTVSSVQANPAVDIAVPDNVRTAAAPPPTVEAEILAEGVYHLRGGSHHSMAVDMGDHIVVIEAPQNDARSEAVIAEAKKLIPGKPIRFVVNTHVHFDHSGGLRTYVDEGATIVTQLANRAFYERAWANPRTVNPDRLAKSRRRASLQTVADQLVLKGAGSRTIELYVLRGNPHNEQTLVAWLPAEKVLFQSDMFNPPAPNAPIPPPSPTLTNFAENLRRLNIQPDRIAGGHGNRVATRADLDKLMGRAATAD